MDHKVAKLVGARIRKLREARGLTQAQLAELGRKSVETISNFERGRTLPGVGTLSQLANHLGVRLRDLVDFDAPLPSRDEGGLSQLTRLLAKDEQRLVAEFAAFLVARRKRPSKRHADH